jgi:glucokinase
MSHAEHATALVADIGGTHARFGLASPASAGRPEVYAVKRYLTADFASLTAAAAHYLQEVAAPKPPSQGVFAVASAVTGDQVKITNNPWAFSIRAVGRDLGFAAIQVINDFSALSRSLPLLGTADLDPIGSVAAKPPAERGHTTYAVVGPGTGLGVGGLTIWQGRAAVMDSEGGHIGFAPGDPYELKVLELLLQQFGRVSAERLISGTGLLNLHRAVCAIEGCAAGLSTPAEITAEAQARPGGVCDRTLALFCELLGSFAGDAALMFGAWDGVYLAGGVVQKVLPWLAAGGFRRRFEAKGRHAGLMRTIPTQVVKHPHAELLGAACLAAG